MGPWSSPSVRISRMILVEVRCARCRSVLRTIDSDEVPEPLAGMVSWRRCQCMNPRAKTGADLEANGRAGNLHVRSPWSDFRMPLAQAKARRRVVVVSLPHPPMRAVT